MASGASFLMAGGEICPQATAHGAVCSGGLRCFPALAETLGSDGLHHPLDAREKTWDHLGRDDRSEIFLSLAGNPATQSPFRFGGV